MAIRRGWNGDAAYVIELLLQLDNSRADTIEWLAQFAKKYDGRGLEFFIDSKWEDARVTAGDESFGQVRIGKYLKKQELVTFLTRLKDVLTDEEQKERAQWIHYQLNEQSTGEIRSLALHAFTERVRRLAAEWLAEHDQYEVGIRVLTELAMKGDGNLSAVRALMNHQEWEKAIHGIHATLANGLKLDDELKAIALLANIGKYVGTDTTSDEVVEAAIRSIELILSGELSEQQTYEVAESLLGGPGNEIGIEVLKVLAASVQHLYRYESATALEINGWDDNAFETLLDIAERWGALSVDRARAIISLNTPLSIHRINQDGIDLHWLAGRIVHEVSCQFSDVNAPPLFGKDAPVLFGNNAPLP